MTHAEIMQARDELMEYWALHGDNLIILAANLQIYKDSAEMWVNIGPRLLSPPSHGLYQDTGANMFQVLKTKTSNLWDTIDGEAALALRAAMKVFIELPDNMKKAGFSNCYCLGHTIKSGETLSNDLVASPSSRPVSIMKSLSDFDKKQSNLSPHERALSARAIIKSLEKLGMNINQNWQKKYISPTLNSYFNMADTKRTAGMDKIEIKKSILAHLTGADLNLFTPYKIVHTSRGAV